MEGKNYPRGKAKGGRNIMTTNLLNGTDQLLPQRILGARGLETPANVYMRTMKSFRRGTLVVTEKKGPAAAERAPEKEKLH